MFVFSIQFSAEDHYFIPWLNVGSQVSLSLLSDPKETIGIVYPFIMSATAYIVLDYSTHAQVLIGHPNFVTANFGDTILQQIHIGFLIDNFPMQEIYCGSHGLLCCFKIITQFICFLMWS